MATIFRRLLTPDRRKEQLLIYVIKHGKSVRLDYSSGIKLPANCWNKRKEVKRTYPNYILLNNQLTSHEAQILIIIYQMILMGIDVTRSHLKQKLDEVFQRSSPELSEQGNKTMSFFDFCDLYIQQSRATKKQRTIWSYIRTIKNLRSKYPNLDFNDITLEFYTKWIHYLRVKCGFLNNTVGKEVKTLKAILNEATDQGYNTNLTFKNKSFKAFREETDSIYLTKNELTLIGNVDLTNRQRLDRVRDLFLIGCNTGLRFSDLSQLKKGNVINRDAGRYIQMRTQKTNNQVMIPLNEEVKVILKKHGGEIPRALSNVQTNYLLKDIGKLAGLDNSVLITKKRAGVLEKHSYRKYELITTHTARRSFATNAYLSCVPALAIMKITGHKSESSFMKYIKGSQEENANTLAQHPFFQ